MVNLSRVDRLMTTRDDPNLGDVIHELKELKRLMTGGTAERKQLSEERLMDKG